jgi:hypothetical protein
MMGCADFSFHQPSLLYARKDGLDLPRYLDKHQSSTAVNSTAPRLSQACRDTLLILGCSQIVESDNRWRGDRPFVPGFACGVGGETLCVTTDQLAEGRFFVRVVSYKRFPYPAAPRFLDGDFCDILVQLLDDAETAKTP